MTPSSEKKESRAIIKERLSIEVTTRCNFECSHCFARAGKAEPASLTLPTVKEILAEGYELGYRHWHITGGEPLLWPSLFAALDYACDLGYQSVFLNTNGAFITPETARRLAACKGMALSVSLDGNEALHERLRGKGTYRLALTGIENALGAGLRLSIFTLACRSLLPNLPKFAEEIYGRYPGLEYLSLIQPIPLEDIFLNPGDGLFRPHDLLDVVDIAGALNLMKLRIRFLHNPLVNVTAKLLNLLWVSNSRPLYTDGSIIVMAGRDICLAHSSRCSFGKYTPGVIGAVLTSDKYRQKVAPDRKTCRTCRYDTVCKEEGMERPSEDYWEIESDSHYCQRVLDGIQTWDREAMQHLFSSSELTCLAH